MTRPTFDITWLLGQVTELQHRPLADDDVVMVCDVDEIIGPDPALATPDLSTYLDRSDESFVNCIGFRVLHQPGTEPPIDLRLIYLHHLDVKLRSLAFRQTSDQRQPSDA